MTTATQKQARKMTRQELIRRAMAVIEGRLERFLDEAEEGFGAEAIADWTPADLAIEFLSSEAQQ